MKRCSLIGLFVLASMAPAQDMPLSQVLIPGEGWKAVDVKIDGHPLSVFAVTTDRKGDLLVSGRLGVLRLTKDGFEKVAKLGPGFVPQICSSPDGSLYAIEVDNKSVNPSLYRLAPATEAKKIVNGAIHVAFSPKGDIYYTAEDPTIGIQFVYPRGTIPTSLYRVGRANPLIQNIGSAARLGFWRDGGTLVVGDPSGDKLTVYRVGKEGTLDAKEGYYTLRTRGRETSNVSALTLDTDGRLFAATTLGVQVFDPTGRMCGVIPPPPKRLSVWGLAFAGPGRDQLYIVCDGKLFVRKTKVKGFVTAAKKP